MERKGRHFLKLSLLQRRILTLIVSLPFWVFAINYFDDWHFTGEASKTYLTIAAVVSFFLMLLIGPSMSEMKALDRKKSSEAIARLKKMGME